MIPSDFEIICVAGWLAGSLVGMLALTIAAGFVTLWGGWASPTDLREYLTIVFGPLVALVASALGFYFGGRNDELRPR